MPTLAETMLLVHPVLEAAVEWDRASEAYLEAVVARAAGVDVAAARQRKEHADRRLHEAIAEWAR